MDTLNLNEAMTISEIVTLVHDYTHENVFIYQFEKKFEICGTYNTYYISLFNAPYTDKIDLIDKLKTYIPRFYKFFNITN